MNLTGEVDVPVVGSVDKRVLIAVGGAGAAFVAWRWWAARGMAGGGEDAPVDPGMEDPGVLPGVAGAVKPDNGYGLDDGGGDELTGYGFRGKSNSQWTQYVTTHLSQSATWPYEVIVTALGAFIGNRPLDATQQQIVGAAIALAGYPPEGSHVIVPGGNTPVTIAPSGLKAVAGSDQASVSWSGVPGASGYYLYRSDQSSAAPQVVAGTSATLYNLTPGREIRVQVAALSAAGKPGPKSGVVTVKTTGAKVATPVGLRGAAARTSVSLTWRPAVGAKYGYVVWHSGSSAPAGFSTDTSASVGGLKPNTSYRFQVAARTGVGEATGARSAPITVKTKR